METDVQALERFVAENDDLLELEERIGRFNVFDALRVARAEIRHSNFLAWLLSPGESHGQGDIFLKGVLMDILRKARAQDVKPPISPIDLDGAELHGVQVRREWKNIDLLIESREPRFVVAIENKVDSGEHSDQLQRYEDTIAASHRGVPALFVFLTPEGEDASDDNWVTYSYADLHRVLSRLRSQAGGSLGADVAVFLEHYLRLVGSRFMSDADIDRLCRQIYTNHRRALELLFERVDVGGSGAGNVIARWMSERPQHYRVLISRAGWVKVLPTAWIGPLMHEDGSPAPGGAELYWEFEVTRTSIKMRCVVGSVGDTERRKRVIQALISEHGRREFGFRMQRKEPTDRWTRIYAERIVQYTEDEPADEDQILKALDKHFAPFQKLAPAIAQVVRSTP